MEQWSYNKTPRASQPFPVRHTLWKDILMEFIVSLPKSSNKSIIIIVVDQLPKYAHFCDIQHSFTLPIISQILFEKFFKIHGMPTSIIYDHDPNFTSKISMKMSTPYHPQTNC